MKVVVLGGGGFIGSTIVDRFLKDGYEVTVFERPRVDPYRDFSGDERVNWVNGDFSSLFDVESALRGAELVVHLISTSLPKSSNDDPIYDVQSNIVATLQMLQACVKLSIKRVLFISSGGTVYGVPQHIPVGEMHPTEPISFYGVTKLAIEKYLALFERNFGLVGISLRVANPYGERQRVETAQGAVAAFLKKAIAGEPIEIWGDGSVTRDFLHVSDVAEAFYAAASYEGAARVFNISSGKGVSLNELIEIIEQVLGRKLNVSYKEARAFDVPISVLSNELALRELAWRPVVGLVEGLSRTRLWFEEH